MRKQRTMPVLCARGLIGRDTEIEVIPEARPANAGDLVPFLETLTWFGPSSSRGRAPVCS